MSSVNSTIDPKDHANISRNSEKEKNRIQCIEEMIPQDISIGLDIGARDGHFSKIIAQQAEQVYAIDLYKPDITHEKIKTFAANIKELPLEDNSTDFTLCAEVLEHLDNDTLEKGLNEINRVSRKYILIGVPNNQDIRLAQTTCSLCKTINPPWGHIQSFSLDKLKDYFPQFEVIQADYIGPTQERTNFISNYLMILAQNPYGTYEQKEHCIHCQKKIPMPDAIKTYQKILAKFAIILDKALNKFRQQESSWIHVLFKKRNSHED